MVKGIWRGLAQVATHYRTGKPQNIDRKGEGFLMRLEGGSLIIEPAPYEYLAIQQLMALIASQNLKAKQIRPCSLCGHIIVIAIRLREDYNNYYCSPPCAQSATVSAPDRRSPR